LYPSGLELFYKGKAMTLARYPNRGFTTIAEEGKDLSFSYSGLRSKKFNFGFRTRTVDDRISSWSNIEDVWIQGYWRWNWYVFKGVLASLFDRNVALLVCELRND
jgi:hypothetical protein